MHGGNGERAGPRSSERLPDGESRILTRCIKTELPVPATDRACITDKGGLETHSTSVHLGKSSYKLASQTCGAKRR